MTKILIIEDEPLVARMLQNMFVKENFNVITAIGGAEGLVKVKNETPDIVLLDIMMPDPNGMVVLEKIKTDEKTKNIPVVMLTNLSGKYDVELALKKGAIDYWVKQDVLGTDLPRKLLRVLKTYKNG